MENQITKRELPKLEELYNDQGLINKQSQLLTLLNHPPRAEWIKTNPFANNSKYLPIDKVEYLLTMIFLKWRLEVKTIQVIANSVVVSVRLHVQDPITGEWDWQDGVGGSPIQTKSGAGATDFTQVNTAAVQMAAPAAESYAFKDAAEKFGKLFGKDLNRKDEMNYSDGLYNKITNTTQLVEVPEDLQYIISVTEDPAKLDEIFKNGKEYHSNPDFLKNIMARKKELNLQTV